MNDCLWRGIRVCKSKCSCDKYVSLNTKTGHDLALKYDKQVKKIIKKHVTPDWKKMFEEWRNE